MCKNENKEKFSMKTRRNSQLEWVSSNQRTSMIILSLRIGECCNDVEDARPPTRSPLNKDTQSWGNQNKRLAQNQEENSGFFIQ